MYSSQMLIVPQSRYYYTMRFFRDIMPVGSFGTIYADY